MLTINDYNNDENIIDNCQQGNHCVMVIRAQGEYLEGRQFKVKLNNQKQNLNTVYQENVIYRLIIAGIQYEGRYRDKYVQLEK